MGGPMVSLPRLRFVLILLTALLIAVGGSVTSAAAAAPVPHERGSAAGQADIPRHTAPPAGPADLAPAVDAAATARTVPHHLTVEALADKARASAGFRSPNQKPVATELGPVSKWVRAIR